jgi:hypothetical protein
VDRAVLISDSTEYRSVLLHRTANRFTNFCPEGRQSPINVRSVLLVGATGTMSGPVRQLLEGAVFGPHFGQLVTGFCDFSYNLNQLNEFK